MTDDQTFVILELLLQMKIKVKVRLAQLLRLRISAILGLFLFESFSLSSINEHRHHIEPVHLLTWSPLVDIILSYIVYIITDILTLIWSTPVFYNPCRIIDNSLWLCFYLDVIAGDLNGFIYAKFDHVI